MRRLAAKSSMDVACAIEIFKGLLDAGGNASRADVATSPRRFFEIGFDVIQKAHAALLILAAAHRLLRTQLRIVRGANAFFIDLHANGADFFSVLAEPVRFVLNFNNLLSKNGHYAEDQRNCHKYFNFEQGLGHVVLIGTSLLKSKPFSKH